MTVFNKCGGNMRRLWHIVLMVICLSLTVSIFSAEKSLNLSPEISTKSYKVQGKLPTEKEKSTYEPFIFSMAFCERLVENFKIYKYISLAELINIGKAVYKFTQGGGGARVTIYDYKYGKDLVVDYYYKNIPKLGICLVSLSNYIEKQDRFTESDEDKGEAWAMIYVVTGKELVNYSYFIDKEEIPLKDDLISIANYYLQDEDTANNVQIEQLLIESINRGEPEKLYMANIILAQYYILTKQYKKSAETLNKVLVCPKPDDGLTIEELFYFTAMELKLAKACGKEIE